MTKGNQLAEEISPYLLQHSNNPVHWQVWGQEALEDAARQNKPILLSIGYAACHWCHVMAHESFEDAQTAALMNEHFINIKVDREERPDLDAIYQSALSLMGQHGGWPLTMFLKPDGTPFWGGTYFPPEPRWGRPGFRHVLSGIAKAFHETPHDIESNAFSLMKGLRQPRSNPGEMIDTNMLDHIAQLLVRELDPQQGGIGHAPKFPQCGLLQLFLLAWRRTGEPQYLDAVTLTLNRMSMGGIYDHLGGGYARYATDDKWLIPHFEKMLYDNAQMVRLLTFAWQETEQPLFRTRLEETLQWVLNEMMAPGGGFASALDADSEGVEGHYYVWTEPEIDAVLKEDAPRFKSAFGVTAQGNWEGKTILNRSHAQGLGTPEQELDLQDLCRRLLACRETRVRPGWDDKVLTDWNGLMIEAMGRAAFVFDRPDWRITARTAYRFVKEHLGQDNRLLHSHRQGRSQFAGTLDDYANMIHAALVLFETSGNVDYRDDALMWLETVETHFQDKRDGGFFFTADDAEALIVRTKSISDSSVPNGNATMVGVYARLYHLTGNASYRHSAEALIKTFSNELQRNFFPLATYLNHVELLQSAIRIEIIGPPTEALGSPLIAELRHHYGPEIVMSFKDCDPSDDRKSGTEDDRVDGGRIAVSLCHDQTCSPLITEPERLRTALNKIFATRQAQGHINALAV